VDTIHCITGLEFDESSMAPLMLRSTTGCVEKVTMLDNQVVVMINLMSILSAEEKKAISDFMETLKETKEE